MYDLIIIGAGPAGMTAAVYAARKRLNCLIVAKDLGGQVMWTVDVENYMGYQYITGPELIAKFEEQVRQFPITIKYEEVTVLERNADGTFTVKTTEESYRSKTVIVASGKRPRRLGVPGEEAFTGRGVSYCATCDGPLFRDKTVAVVGGGNSGVQAAIELSGVARKVYLIVRERYVADPILIERMKQAPNIVEFIGYESDSIWGTQTVEKFTVKKTGTEERQDLDVQGIFVEIGLIPNTEFLGELVPLNEWREVAVDCRTRSIIPGLYAAGDVASGPDKQIVIAAGDGAKAALIAYDYLLHKE